MSDPLRFDRPPGELPDGRERDARIEDLLLTGLDHYFAGQHDLAINVWTRVLFLDRSHGKARAYIERARSALAERQREADELLQTGQDALNRGDRHTARRLLTSAERVGGSEEALNLLHRLDRLDAAAAEPVARQPTAVPTESGSHPDLTRRDGRIAWAFAGVIAGVLLAVLVGAYLWLVSDPFELAVVRSAAPPTHAQPLPVPSPSEIRLTRARGLFAGGRLREALALLEAGSADERRADGVEELRAIIQRRLIQEGRDAAGFTPVEVSSGTGGAAGRQTGTQR